MQVSVQAKDIREGDTFTDNTRESKPQWTALTNAKPIGSDEDGAYVAVQVQWRDGGTSERIWLEDIEVTVTREEQ